VTTRADQPHTACLSGKLDGYTIPFEPGHQAFVVREPHGVTAHIIPWNYPAQMFARDASAALAAGNAMVMKPAEDACLSALHRPQPQINADFLISGIR
jgi:aldehyde dehydrogenase (NAD+)